MPVAGQLFGNFFTVGVDALNCTLDQTTGMPLLQIGDSIAQTVEASNCELWQQPGLASLPANPTQGASSCQFIALKRSDHDMAFAGRDARASAIYGNLAPGETCLYATTGQARIVCKADGSINAVTTDSNAAGGNSVFWRVNPTEERFFSPFAQRWTDATGFHIRTNSGAKLDIGGIGLPAPFSSYGSYATLTAEIIHLDAAVLSLGRENGFLQPVVLATSMATVMGNLSAAIVALNAAIATAVPASGITAANIAAAATAVGVAVTALATVALPAATGGCASVTSIA